MNLIGYLERNARWHPNLNRAHVFSTIRYIKHLYSSTMAKGDWLPFSMPSKNSVLSLPYPQHNNEAISFAQFSLHLTWGNKLLKIYKLCLRRSHGVHKLFFLAISISTTDFLSKNIWGQKSHGAKWEAHTTDILTKQTVFDMRRGASGWKGFHSVKVRCAGSYRIYYNPYRPNQLRNTSHTPHDHRRRKGSSKSNYTKGDSKNRHPFK